MGDAFGRFIAVILFVAVLVLTGMGCMYLKTVNAKEIYAREVLEEFCAELVADGQVTVEKWEQFQAELARNGYLYEIDLCIGRYEEAVSEE